MIRASLAFLAFALFSSFALAQAPDPDRDRTDKALAREVEELADVTKNVLVPMRDGVGLSTDIYLPKNRKGKAPAILIKSPYNYNPLGRYELNWLAKFLRRGYAVILQNERGKYYSEGDWEILGHPQTDGVDMLDWIEEQEWSTGKVGLIGCSSTAEWQLSLAAQNHPALAAMVPMGSGAGMGKIGEYWEQGNWYKGGAEQLLFSTWLYDYIPPSARLLPSGDLSPEERERVASLYPMIYKAKEVQWSKALKALPLMNLMQSVGVSSEAFEKMMARTPGDPEWRAGGLFHDDENIDAPALWLFSWYDVGLAPNIALFNHARTNTEDREAANAQFMAVGPNLHCRFFAESVGEAGDRTFPDAALGYYDMVFDFLDRYVKGERNGFERSTPKVQYYEMGADAWRKAESWPPKGASELSFFLDATKGANSLYGDGVLAAQPLESGAEKDSFVYDPMNPVPSVGGGVCCLGDAVKPGVFDQRSVESRNDVLVYTSAPLEKGVHVAGPVKLTLYVSSDAPDTDFMVKLVDVFPDGTAYNIDDTAQRVRWREGYDKPPVFMKEGEVYEVTIQPMVTANYFAPGHRIRLEVTSSNFPRYSRNLNTEEHVPAQKEPRVARNAVHHTAEHPSKLTLTVVPN